MAAEDIGNVYKTKIPGYDDTADIQAALKLFHYGSETVPTTYGDINPDSLAGHLKDLQDQVDVVDARGIGSDYLLEDDIALLTPTDGFIAMASDSNGGMVESLYASAFLTTQAPTEGITNGVLWVDADTPALELNIYNASGTEWIRVNDIQNLVENTGDILVGSSAGTLDNLSVSGEPNGKVLTVNDSSPLGVSWEEVPQTDTESIIISSIMGAY